MTAADYLVNSLPLEIQKLTNEFKEHKKKKRKMFKDEEQQSEGMSFQGFSDQFLKDFTAFKSAYEKMHNDIFSISETITLELDTCSTFAGSLKTLFNTYCDFPIRSGLLLLWKHRSYFMKDILNDVSQYFKNYKENPAKVSFKLFIDIENLSENIATACFECMKREEKKLSYSYIDWSCDDANDQSDKILDSNILANVVNIYKILEKIPDEVYKNSEKQENNYQKVDFEKMVNSFKKLRKSCKRLFHATRNKFSTHDIKDSVVMLRDKIFKFLKTSRSTYNEDTLSDCIESLISSCDSAEKKRKEETSTAPTEDVGSSASADSVRESSNVCKLRVKIKTLRSEFTEHENQTDNENETCQKEISTTSTENVGSSASAVRESSNEDSKSFEKEENGGAHGDAMELDSEDNNVGGKEECMIVKKENQENQKEEMEFTEREYQRDDKTFQPEKQKKMEWVDFFPRFEQNFIDFKTNYHDLHTGILKKTISLEACDNFEKSLKTLLDTYYSFSKKQERWGTVNLFMDSILLDVENYFKCYEKDPEKIGITDLLPLIHVKELEQGIAKIKENVLEIYNLFDDWYSDGIGENLDPIDKPISHCLDVLFYELRSILKDVFDIYTELGDIHSSTQLDSVIKAVRGILKTLEKIAEETARSPFKADIAKSKATRIIEDINKLDIEIRKTHPDKEKESLDIKMNGWKQSTKESIDKLIAACRKAIQERKPEGYLGDIDTDDYSRDSEGYEAGNGYSSSGLSYDNGCEETKNEDENDCEKESNKMPIIDNVIETDGSEDEH